ncbi:N-acetylglucosamine-6-phosphate deacetylase [Roseibacterium sp. SDUM158017]|uniref:N-acetylglucosamine-6-phosphate deacetylase n=1 Tax=Roseicyclus salinarum TaxID=3036773 RepID=UPI0024150EF7|nr:N-acetylglucosamine-6-phosphate deacetylase [Roseibacterium sp. SDUM158017]MDG4647610.1 N-acetylglucosamine-6-phosphate deacetylase [Roseibacterium sp. SDUM158017]
MKLSAVDILDGDGWRRGVDLRIAEGRIADIAPSVARKGAPVVCPAPIDLQVNGGGGWMLGDCEAPGDVLEILSAHRRLGTAAILPTLVSDTPQATEKVIHLVETARRADAGILGLHLEGPHIAVPGAHDPERLRDLTSEDVARYIDAKARLGTLMITLAPERATPDLIAELARAGILVALGHTACTCEAAEAAFDAGARMATHLYNAMSGLHHRAPGLVGAALTRAEAFGLIADGHHVADAALKVALAARGHAAIPVSDAMAVAGTERTGFVLSGREVLRRDGRLTLEDGTLAGADISLVQGLGHIARLTGRPLAEVMPMGFERPHRLLTGRANRLAQGTPARLIHIEGDHVEGFDGKAWHVLHASP